MANYPSNKRRRPARTGGGKADYLSVPVPTPVTVPLPGSPLPEGVNDNFPGKYWPPVVRVTKRAIWSRLLFLAGLGILYGAFKRTQPIEWSNIGPWRIYAQCLAPDIQKYNIRGQASWGQMSNSMRPLVSSLTGCLGLQANPGLVWGTMTILTTTRAVIWEPWGDPTGTGVFRGQITTGWNRALTGTVIPVPTRHDLGLFPGMVDVPPFDLPGDIVDPILPGKVPAEPLPVGVKNLPGSDPVETDPYTGLPVRPPAFTRPGFNPNPGHVVIAVPIPVEPEPGLGPEPLPPVEHPPHLNERPPEGVRERKMRVGGPLARIAVAVIGAVTEAADFWAAMWKALPKKVQAEYKSYYRDDRGRLHGVAPRPHIKARAVLQHWDEIDWVKAVGYLLYNHAQDAAVGLVGKIAKQRARRLAELYGVDIRNGGQPSRLTKSPSFLDIAGQFGG